MKVFLCVLLLGVLTAPAAAEQLWPYDDSGEVPDFVPFKRRLLQAIRDRDADFIFSIIDAESQIGSRYGGGFPDWRNPYDPAWDTLERIIKLGAHWDSTDRAMVFPSLWKKLMSAGWKDLHSDGVIAGQNVNLRRGPSLQAPVVARLSFDRATMLEWAGDWVKVRTDGGQVGYIHRDFFLTLSGYRAAFSKRVGQWRIDFFVYGAD